MEQFMTMQPVVSYTNSFSETNELEFKSYHDKKKSVANRYTNTHTHTSY